MAKISSITLPNGDSYDLKDKDAQRKITVSGILKGDGQGGVSAATAGDVPYDNADSGLTAEDVQEAIDELAAGAGGGGVDPETIAPVEETATATIVHPLGSIFYFNDILYRAIEDIPVGGTINTATGGNATQTTIAQNFKRTVTLTSAEYAQLSIAEKTADIVYIITDDNSIRANDVNYDHETSGASTTNVQDALDEVFSELGGKQPTITASGILKGDGTGGVTAATAGTDFQAPLTIDATPTASSTNPVQSGGVYTDVRTRVPVYGKGVNLLRNWYFVGGGTGRGVFPVNQRGVISYVAPSAQFGPDAWKVYAGSTLTLTAAGATLSNGGVVVTNIQRNDSLWGKEVTLSVLTSGGIYTASGTMPSSAPASQTTIITISNSALQLVFRVYGNDGITSLAWWSYDPNVVYYAFKLELGSEQTLAHQENGTWVLNEVPDYEYELYRCITSTADPSDTYANKSLATGEELAYVENGTTASRNYSAGQYISLNGLLYTADTAIASGATFYTSGGNKNLTECVGGGLNSLSTVTSDNVTFSNNVTGYTYQNEYHLSKSGNVVVANIVMSASSIAGMGTVLCTVPAAFRPSVNRRIAAWLTYSGDSKVETVYITPDGTISTASGGYNVTGFIRVFGTYIL